VVSPAVVSPEDVSPAVVSLPVVEVVVSPPVVEGSTAVVDEDVEVVSGGSPVVGSCVVVPEPVIPIVEVAESVVVPFVALSVPGPLVPSAEPVSPELSIELTARSSEAHAGATSATATNHRPAKFRPVMPIVPSASEPSMVRPTRPGGYS
jgi:hypothetical protein